MYFQRLTPYTIIYIEKGVFSKSDPLYAYTTPYTMGLPSIDSYKQALGLFNALGEDPYLIAKDCRTICGNFFSIDEETLKVRCPKLPKHLVKKLLTKPIMR